MNGTNVAAARTGRRQILIEGSRILGVSFLGWTVGAILVATLGAGTLASDVGSVVVAAALWATVSLSILRLLRWRAGSTYVSRQRPRTWAIWFVLVALTGSTLIGVARPLIETWSTLQIWSAIFLFTPIGIALDTLPRFIRPQGWTSALAATPRRIPVALVALSLGVFTLSMATANGLLDAGQDHVSLVPTLPFEALVVASLISLLGVFAFAAGVPGAAHAVIALLFAASSFVIQLVWLPVQAGYLVVDRPMLVASHVAAALALIVAAAVVQLFRDAGTSAVETALVEWLRAEAILPEASAAGSKASG